MERFDDLIPLVKPIIGERYNQMRTQFPLLPTLEDLDVAVMQDTDAFRMEFIYTVRLRIGPRFIGINFSIHNDLVTSTRAIQTHLTHQLTEGLNRIMELIDQFCGTDGYQQLANATPNVRARWTTTGTAEMTPSQEYELERRRIWTVKENDSVYKIEASPNAKFSKSKVKRIDKNPLLKFEASFVLTKTDIAALGKEFGNCLGSHNSERKYGFLVIRVGESRKLCMCLTTGEAKAAKNARPDEFYIIQALKIIKRLGVVYNEKADDFEDMFIKYAEEIKPRSKVSDMANILKVERDFANFIRKSEKE